MICSKCGTQNSDQNKFCNNCGAPLNTAEQSNQQPYQQPTYQQPAYQQSNLDYTPISMWGYFGYELLFSIPCIGFIFLLIFAFGGSKNVNVRNFARSYFCLFIILIAIILLVSVIGGIGLGSLINSLR